MRIYTVLAIIQTDLYFKRIWSDKFNTREGAEKAMDFLMEHCTGTNKPVVTIIEEVG